MAVKVKLSIDTEMKEIVEEQKMQHGRNKDIPESFRLKGELIENGSKHVGLSWDLIKQCARDWSAHQDNKTLAEYMRARIVKSDRKHVVTKRLPSSSRKEETVVTPDLPTSGSREGDDASLALPDGGPAAQLQKWLQKQFADQQAALGKEMREAIVEQRESVKRAVVDEYLDENNEDLKATAVKQLLDDRDSDVEEQAIEHLVAKPSDHVVTEAAEKLINDASGVPADVKKKAIRILVGEPTAEVLEEAAARLLETDKRGRVEQKAVEMLVREPTMAVLRMASKRLLENADDATMKKLKKMAVHHLVIEEKVVKARQQLAHDRQSRPEA